MSETPSFPAWYITFQTDVLSQLPRPGDDPGQISQVIADGWHSNRAGLNKVLIGGLIPPKLPEKPVLRLIPVASGVHIPAVVACNVRNLFKGRQIVLRNGDLDLYFRKRIPAVGSGGASSYRLGDHMSFYEMVAQHLMVAGNIAAQERILLEKEKFFSLKQVEDIFRACQKSENPLGLRIDGSANLFPVWDGVSLLFLVISWSRYDLYVDIRPFNDGTRWSVGDVVFFRN